ncbi:MAG: ABC transporter substrate-binding protein [Bacillota bacterium]|nr:ABC transporter substrate-binding protein [Bacillota bacterium]
MSKMNFIKVHVVLLSLVLLFTTAANASITVEQEPGSVIVPVRPQRVVVFDYGVLDVLDTLGIQIVGLPKASLPSYLERYDSDEYVDVGTLFEPNFERIYELKPDVILIGGRQLTLFDELNRIAPTVLFSIDSANFWPSFRANLELLGRIFAQAEVIGERVTVLETKLTALGEQAAASGLRTLILQANDGTLAVYGPNSRFGIIHQDLRFAPVDEGIVLGTHGMSISFEYLVRTNPDLIFVIDRAAVVGGSISAQQVLDNPLVKMTTAAQNSRIVYLNAEAWYVASGGLKAAEIMLTDIEQAFSK